MKWKRTGLSLKQNKLYREANEDWDTLAFHYPLLHRKSNTNIHIVGIHHNSPASLHRVESVIQQLKPAKVLIELHKKSLDYVLNKTAILNQPIFQQRVAHVIEGKSPQNIQLTSSESKTLSMYGMGDFDLTKNQILYSLEFAQAIKHAENIGAAIEYIDESPSDLKEMIHQETPNIAKVAQSRFRLYHHRFRSSPSFLGEAMYQLLSFWIFRAKPILKYIEEDYVGIGELKTHLELWSRFHPAAYYWSLGLRDAVMTERIRMSVMDIRVNEALSHLDPNTIVVVVGKSHYFGIKYLWESFVEGNPPYARPQHS